MSAFNQRNLTGRVILGLILPASVSCSEPKAHPEAPDLVMLCQKADADFSDYQSSQQNDIVASQAINLCEKIARLSYPDREIEFQFTTVSIRDLPNKAPNCFKVDKIIYGGANKKYFDLNNQEQYTQLLSEANFDSLCKEELKSIAGYDKKESYSLSVINSPEEGLMQAESALAFDAMPELRDVELFYTVPFFVFETKKGIEINCLSITFLNIDLDDFKKVIEIDCLTRL